MYFCCRFVFLLIFSLVYAIDINCKYSSRKGTYSTSRLFCCIEENLRITTRNEIVSIKNPKKFEGILTEGKEILYFPPRFGNQTGTLRAIIMTNSKLREITSVSIENYKSLRYLDFSGNEIQNLEANLFYKNKELEKIILDDNKISSIDPAAFRGLARIKKFTLQNNVCLSASTDNKIDISKLMMLSLESCWIQSPRFDDHLESTSFKKTNLVEKVQNERQETVSPNMNFGLNEYISITNSLFKEMGSQVQTVNTINIYNKNASKLSTNDFKIKSSFHNLKYEMGKLQKHLTSLTNLTKNTEKGVAQIQQRVNVIENNINELVQANEKKYKFIQNATESLGNKLEMLSEMTNKINAEMATKDMNQNVSDDIEIIRKDFENFQNNLMQQFNEKIVDNYSDTTNKINNKMMTKMSEKLNNLEEKSKTFMQENLKKFDELKQIECEKNEEQRTTFKDITADILKSLNETKATFDKTQVENDNRLDWIKYLIVMNIILLIVIIAFVYIIYINKQTSKTDVPNLYYSPRRNNVMEEIRRFSIEIVPEYSFPYESNYDTINNMTCYSTGVSYQEPECENRIREEGIYEAIPVRQDEDFYLTIPSANKNKIEECGSQLIYAVAKKD